MAKITVTTDDGGVVGEWADDQGDLPNLSLGPDSEFHVDLEHDLRVARRREGRHPDTGARDVR